MSDQTTPLRRRLVPKLCLAFAVLATVTTSARAQSLKTAESFAALGATTVTNTGATQVSGDVGVSPGTAITGFPPGVVINGALHAGDGPATQAHADFATAYTAFAGLASPPANNLSGADLGGMTLTPGVYRYNGAATSNGMLTFDAQGDGAARFVVQIGTTLVTSGTSSVALINGASARNVFFQVGSSATLAAGSSFTGNILANTSITAVSGSSVIGRLLVRNGAVTLDTNRVALPMLPEWHIAGTADFNADGFADLVWENTTTGERVIWFLQDGQYQTGNGVNLGTYSPDWHIAGAADFNGDRYADLVWENTKTGERAIWFLQNGQHQSGNGVNLGTYSPDWHIAGAADFNADGFADLVWENTTTGERAIWFLQNGQHQSGEGLALGIYTPDWHIAGAADFNADRFADLAWENTKTGERAIWFLQNGQHQSDNGVTLPTTEPSWQISGR